MPGEAPLEGLATDWIAPRDVISRQPRWITFPGLPCLAGPTNHITQSCHVAAHFSLSFFLFTPLAYLLHLPPLGCVPHRNSKFTTCWAIQTLWGRPADGPSDWLSAHVYFLVVGTSDEINTVPLDLSWCLRGVYENGKKVLVMGHVVEPVGLWLSEVLFNFSIIQLLLFLTICLCWISLYLSSARRQCYLKHNNPGFVKKNTSYTF